jgi:2'-5' RNA ligase
MGKAQLPDSVTSEDVERFRNIPWLHDHWSRSGSRRAYYWYLTFEHCADLHSLARRCQEAISFPYYDLTPPGDLHLTLDRVAFDDDVSTGVLGDITAAAILACQQVSAFEITIGPLGGTAGAIGFSASPGERLKRLRDKLRAATLSVYPDAPVGHSEFHAHVAIAYANSDNVPAADAVAAVEKLNATVRTDVKVKVAAGTLVVLEQRSRSYAWEAVSRIPLAS